MFFQKEGGLITQWSFKHNMLVHTYPNDGETLLDLVITPDNKFMWANSLPYFFKWELSTKSRVQKVGHSEASLLYIVM